MKVKTSELIDRALDWAVAKCEGLNPNTDPETRQEYVGYPGFAEHNGFGHAIKNYSTNWTHGGPIIEKHGIGIKSETKDHSTWSAQFAYCRQVVRYPEAELVFSYCLQHGTSALVAAMRCYVYSKFGEFVNIPDELAR